MNNESNRDGEFSHFLSLESLKFIAATRSEQMQSVQTLEGWLKLLEEEALKPENNCNFDVVGRDIPHIIEILRAECERLNQILGVMLEYVQKDER